MGTIGSSRAQRGVEFVGNQVARAIRIRDRLTQEGRFFRTVPPSALATPRKLLLLVRIRRHSMLDYARLSSLHDLACRIRARGIEGTFVECGSCNGGSGAVLATIAANDPVRMLWLFDSWQGLPEPGSDDVSIDGRPGYRGMAVGRGQETAEALLFDRLRLDRNRVRLVAGWFDETIEPRLADLRPIALLHLDSDWYDSIKYCLETLYDAVSPRGAIVIDDYEYWRGCKRAVDDFLAERQLAVELHHVGVAIWFEKP